MRSVAGDDDASDEVALNTSVVEEALVLACEGDFIVGVLSAPPADAKRGVLFVVGGPQYRAGSHRQLTLLARHLADAGIASLRFDYRGTGDSTGEVRSFERAGTDIRCAIDRFLATVPAVKEVVIWGLCDAASAALIYAHQDPRVSALVLLNPWVRTEQGIARAHLRHYYLARLFHRSLWQKIGRGEFDVREAAAAFGKFVADAVRPSQTYRDLASAPLPERMLDGLRRFHGRVMLILSGKDLTAQEFQDLTASSADWRSLLGQTRVTRYELPEANHTFARRDWRNQVARWTAAWVKAG